MIVAVVLLLSWLGVGFLWLGFPRKHIPRLAGFAMLFMTAVWLFVVLVNPLRGTQTHAWLLAVVNVIGCSVAGLIGCYGRRVTWLYAMRKGLSQVIRFWIMA